MSSGSEEKEGEEGEGKRKWGEEAGETVTATTV
jgi:hypothetical protein